MKKNLKAQLLVAGMIGAVTAVPAWAQEKTAVAAPVDEADNSGLQDIIVTAQRREERLEKVPVRVVALNADALAARGITSVKDLSAAVPALVTNEAIGLSQYFLRGIGQDQLVPFASPGVPVYEDGIANQLLVPSLGQLLGVDRMEVVYGPQGTLYGRNAIGGAINIVTKTPTDQTEFGGRLGYGKYNRYEVSGYASGGLTDTLAAGLYAAATGNKTYYKFTQKAADQPMHEKAYAVRGKAVWTPSDSTKVTVVGEYAFTRIVDGAIIRQADPRATGFVLGNLPRITADYQVQADGAYFIDVKRYKGGLTIEQDLSDFATLTSITGYQEANYEQRNDSDATGFFVARGGGINPKVWDFSQELRLQSPSSSIATWVVGAYYDKAGQGFRPVPRRQPTANTDVYVPIETNGKAVFAQLSYPFAEGLKATVGARYNWDEHKRLPGKNVTTVLATGVTTTTVTSGSAKVQWKSFTPKATLEYQAGPALTYITLAKGFKVGQFNPSVAANLTPVNPERLTDLEGGVKVDLMDHRLRINASLFHYWYKNLQVSRVVQLATGPVTVTDNAAKAKLYGGDLTFTAIVVPGVTLTNATSYIHSEYTQYDGALYFTPGATSGYVSTPRSASGNTLQRVPKWTNSFSADVRHELGNGGSIQASGNWQYTGKFPWDASNLYFSKSYSLLNAQVGYTLPSDTATFTLWAKNIANKHYLNFYLPNAIGLFTSDSQPRTYGASISFKFK